MVSFSRPIMIGLAVFGLGGCSTIVKGTSQDIFVNTSPTGASCALERQGQVIGRVASTPGSVKVSKSKDDILITCDKTGYQTATYYNNSGWEGGTGGAGIALDIIVTLGASSLIDSATGADNRYETPVNLYLAKSENEVPSTSRAAGGGAAVQ